jgi:hypothetical protein
MRRAKGGPLRLGFLHPILAEIALSGGDQGLDGFGRLGLGDGDQDDFPGLTPRFLRRLVDGGPDGGKPPSR